MKPRIFIAIHYMHLGGAEISLIGLLQALDPKKVDVDLFVYSHEGELMKYIPDYVNLLPEIPAYKMFERPMKEVLKKGHLSVLFARMKAKMRKKFYLNKKQAIDVLLGEEVSKVVPDINPSVEYDLAISFLTPHNFVRDHVRAKKKVCWIHTDYTRIDVNAELELPVWDSYDYVASVSSEVSKTFLQVFPSLAPKVIEVENILSSSFVGNRAEEFKATELLTDKKYLNLLSVGRFCEAKNYDSVPDICNKALEILKGEGVDLRWYIIGFGGEEELIRQKIVEAGMQEHVIILGKKSNPYPYIKACDIYVQPSRYEGKSVTVREAQMLYKPVVVTNYPTASSQIQNGIDGVIVPMYNEGCAKGLAEFILDEAKQSQIVEYLKTHDYGNINAVNKIYTILGL